MLLVETTQAKKVHRQSNECKRNSPKVQCGGCHKEYKNVRTLSTHQKKCVAYIQRVQPVTTKRSSSRTKEEMLQSMSMHPKRRQTSQQILSEEGEMGIPLEYVC